MDILQLGDEKNALFTGFVVPANYSVRYTDIVNYVRKQGTISVNRKSQQIYEVHNAVLILDPEAIPYCLGRFPSLQYLEKELEFYRSGSLKLEDAVKMSKFWNNCSDDGKTINSNYGYLLFHDRNTHGHTQFEHAINCLKNNPDSKKAVMTLYSKEHSYISNDNPCTLVINLYIRNNKLHMQTIMRSNDLWFGLPYDLPFLRVVHFTAKAVLKRTYPLLELGTYIHQVLNLHIYERDLKKFEENEDRLYTTQNTSATVINCSDDEAHLSKIVGAFTMGFINLYYDNYHKHFINEARRAALSSRCLKKKCGAVLVHNGKIVATGYGDRDGDSCTSCARDQGEVFYSDGCYSVHAEMRACIAALKQGFSDWEDAIVYVTHGPCDACLKLLNHLGVRKVIYDVPYKTDYKGHWPNITVLRLDELKQAID